MPEEIIETEEVIEVVEETPETEIEVVADEQPGAPPPGH